MFSEDVEDLDKLCTGVVIQNGKLAAVVTFCDEESKLLICECAEKYARAVAVASCERKFFGIANGFADYMRKKAKPKRG